jgi:hypothetical protein
MEGVLRSGHDVTASIEDCISGCKSVGNVRLNGHRPTNVADIAALLPT